MDEGREHYIIGRALYEAVCRLDRLPIEQRPESDMDDMLELLSSRYLGVLEIMLLQEKLKPPPPPIARLVAPAKPSEDEPAP